MLFCYTQPFVFFCFYYTPFLAILAVGSYSFLQTEAVMNLLTLADKIELW